MTYQEAEQYLLSLSNLPRAEYMTDRRRTKNYLKRLQFFLSLLGNPECRIPHYIHVTGTSGKGSVCGYIASILSANGAKTGLYISPHPTQLTERWQINGRPMPRSEFARIVTRIKPKLDDCLRESPYDMISFFDITTAIALYYFAQKKVKWAVMEVGCGGKLDSTNVIPYKDVAVITTIGLDHTELLGDTKEKIASEKSGIIQNTRSVFTMVKEKNILKILSSAARRAKIKKVMQSPLSRLTGISTTTQGTKFIYGGVPYHLPHIGKHQAVNAAMVIDIAKSLKIKQNVIIAGLSQTKQPLRLEIVEKNPLVILDGAHNTDKIKTTVQAIDELMAQAVAKTKSADNTRADVNNKSATKPKLHLIVGFSDDKNYTRMMGSLARLSPISVACTRNTVNIFRKVADPARLAKLARRMLPKAKIKTWLDPAEAYAWIRRCAKHDDIILITGSIFLSGELRGRLTKT